jgi:FMN phosphatase YigB (HAD superfamily)
MEKFQDRFLEEVKEKFAKLGIKALLFDFDDTLIYTQELFIKYMDEYVAKVSLESGLDLDIVRGDLERLNNEEFKKMGVNPERWAVVAQRMADEREGYGESTINSLKILGKIYTDSPRVKPGAVAMLEILRMADTRMALVTHANEDWTLRKLENTGVADYFEVIKIVDENKHKGVEDWKEVADKMGILPKECLILGDSLGGDIIPGDMIGARTVWLHTGSTWSMYRAGTVPEATVHLDNINELLSALEELT